MRVRKVTGEVYRIYEITLDWPPHPGYQINAIRALADWVEREGVDVDRVLFNSRDDIDLEVFAAETDPTGRAL